MIELQRVFIINEKHFKAILNDLPYFIAGCTVTNSTAATTTEGPCVPTTTTNPTPLTCTCINFVSPGGDGNCLTSSPDPTHCDLRFCYVDPATNTCLDAVESTTIPGLFYSAQACL